MSVHRSISLWGVWYLQRKSTPKNEVLRLKTLDFWRLYVLSCPKISIPKYLKTQLSQNIYPPNGHIIEGHLCIIMSGCSPAINSRPLQPLVGWLLREKLTLVIWEHPILRGLWAKIIKWGKPKPKHLQTQNDWASLKRFFLCGSDACYLWRLCIF